MSKEFIESLKLACQPQNASLIVCGRSEVCNNYDRQWVIDNIEEYAKEHLNLTDFWEYRRLLELGMELHSVELMKRLVAAGVNSTDPDMKEAVEDFKNAHVVSPLEIIKEAYTKAGVDYVVREHQSESTGKYYYLVKCNFDEKEEFADMDFHEFVSHGFMEFYEDGSIASY